MVEVLIDEISMQQNYFKTNLLSWKFYSWDNPSNPDLAGDGVGLGFEIPIQDWVGLG